MGNKFREIFCVFFGHSKIVSYCFGYVGCARCNQQMGDCIGGVYPMQDKVIVGHDCETCRDNYKRLGWRDKLFTTYPFREGNQ